MPLEKYPRSVPFSRFQSTYRIDLVITFRNFLSIICISPSDKFIANKKIELNPAPDRTCIGIKQSYGSRNFLTRHLNFDRASEL